MNPNPEQPQDTPVTPQPVRVDPPQVEELPSVPQIPQAEPQAPVMQTPEQTPVASTLPATPETAAQAAVTEPSAPVEPTNPAIPEPVIPATTQFPQSLDETPPLPPTQEQTVQPTPESAPVLAPAPKKKTGLIIGAVVGGIVILAAAVFTVFFFMANSDKVSNADLVTSKDDNTVYLRPKQWQAIANSSGAGYGDKKGPEGKSTALILVKKGIYVKSGIINATRSEKDAFGESVLDSTSKSDAEKMVKESGECNSVSDVNMWRAVTDSMNVVGALRVDGICVRDTATYKLAIYVGLGNDGYTRTAVVMATESLWKQNVDIYTHMLESVDQV